MRLQVKERQQQEGRSGRTRAQDQDAWGSPQALTSFLTFGPGKFSETRRHWRKCQKTEHRTSLPTPLVGPQHRSSQTGTGKAGRRRSLDRWPEVTLVSGDGPTSDQRVTEPESPVPGFYGDVALERLSILVADGVRFDACLAAGKLSPNNLSHQLSLCRTPHLTSLGSFTPSVIFHSVSIRSIPLAVWESHEFVRSLSHFTEILVQIPSKV